MNRRGFLAMLTAGASAALVAVGLKSKGWTAVYHLSTDLTDGAYVLHVPEDLDVEGRIVHFRRERQIPSYWPRRERIARLLARWPNLPIDDNGYATHAGLGRHIFESGAA